MDTKSTRIKYSLPVKALCFTLSAVMIFMSSFFAIRAAAKIFINASVESVGESSETAEFKNSGVFGLLLQSPLNAMSYLASWNSIDDEISKIENAQDATVNEALNQFLTQKAKIIEKELYYVVNDYMSNDYDYDDTNSYMDYTQTTTAVSVASDTTEQSTSATSATTQAAAVTENRNYMYLVDVNAPKNVQAACSVLNTTSGLGFLQYQYLVRQSAFTEENFYYIKSFDFSGGHYFNFDLNFNYDRSEEEAKRLIKNKYENSINEYNNEMNYILENNKTVLGGCVNLKYYAVSADGKNVYTNIENTASVGDMNHNVAFMYENGSMKQTGLDSFIDDGKAFLYGSRTLEEIVQDNDRDNNIKVYFYMDTDKLQSGDTFYTANSIYDDLIGDKSTENEIIIAAVLLVLAIAMLVVTLCLSGHKNGFDGITLSFIDRMPTDIHTLISFGLIIASAALGIFAIDACTDYAFGSRMVVIDIIDRLSIEKAIGFASTIVALTWIVFGEWISSVVRIKKSGGSFFRRFLVWRILCLCGRLLKRVFTFCKKTFCQLKQLIAYKPSHFKRTVIIYASLYVAITFIASILCIVFPPNFFIVVGLNVFVLYKLLKYIKTLDEIITASGNRSVIISDTSKMPESLRTLADSLRVTQRELDVAVSKAVKDERMKTELITNVSHDLKTPLTAVISYVDLLKKCDINDEDAQKYIGVLDEKSIKLKRLIEDLIEASKASSGNVTLNKTSVNLNELTVQLIGEMEDDFSEKGLEIIFTEPKTAPIIFADSQKTFRVIDNLLNNAKKYSLQNSRVYISVYSEETSGVFEIKNVSESPLNISPEELTERFVRGDESRTNEGNGLGLSIAKDLCTLQGGTLSIAIDGDLFKVTVRLPINQ